jgi:hypothetical protein
VIKHTDYAEYVGEDPTLFRVTDGIGVEYGQRSAERERKSQRR